MFTSSWGQQSQQQQQQQPQQQTGAFGQPTGFGATTNNNGEFSFLTHHRVYKPHGAFGSTSAFSQPQQQQPQVNPMFGNIGAPSTSA
jgi:nuclear pore complex protein Nup98-Nup96